MSGRFWIFLGAVSGLLAVIAGAIGAHALPDPPAPAVSIHIYNIGQVYHVLHSLALVSAGLAILNGEGRQTSTSRRALQLAGVAFTAGIICFSGGIYVQVAKGLTSSGGIVPFGGMSLMLGWAALAIGALGLRR
jgi:uncharacterized membrane protein YgdD (TMEM256/DUF423 family)